MQHTRYILKTKNKRSWINPQKKKDLLPNKQNLQITLQTTEYEHLQLIVLHFSHSLDVQKNSTNKIDDSEQQWTKRNGAFFFFKYLNVLFFISMVIIFFFELKKEVFTITQAYKWFHTQQGFQLMNNMLKRKAVSFNDYQIREKYFFRLYYLLPIWWNSALNKKKHN